MAVRAHKALHVTWLVALSWFLPVLLNTDGIGAHASITAAASISFNYGNYVSEYVRLDSSDYITWDQSVGICTSYGTGWHIAGAYNSAGNAALASILPSGPGTTRGYIGGYSYPGFDYSTLNFYYVWYAGRFQGQPVSQGLAPNTACLSYCNYAGGEPNGAGPCAGNSYQEHALELYNTGTWNDLSPEGCAGYTFSTALCERSLCTVAADCVAANTVSVSNSYAPDCTCTCKTGFRGPRCQIPSTSITISGVEYAGNCDPNPLNAPTAQTRCKAMGSGWNLASIPSSAVDAAIRGMSMYTMWTGGTRNDPSSNYIWQYGRRAGVVFTTSSGCVSGMYCNWLAGNPDHAMCTDDSQYEKDIAVMSTVYSQQWNDLYPNGCGHQARLYTYCYVCERSPCVQSDCPSKRFTRPRGYYPNCKCSTISATVSTTVVITDSLSIRETLTQLITATHTGGVKTVTQTASDSPTKTPLSLSSTSTLVLSSSKTLSLSGSGSLTMPPSTTATILVSASLASTSKSTTSTLGRSVTAAASSSTTAEPSQSATLSDGTLTATKSTAVTVSYSISHTKTMSLSASPSDQTASAFNTQTLQVTLSNSVESTQSAEVTASLTVRLTLSVDDKSASTTSTSSITQVASHTLATTNSVGTPSSSASASNTAATASLKLSPSATLPPTQSHSYSSTAPPTATHSATNSMSHASPSQTTTMPQSVTATYAADASKVGELLVHLPLFTLYTTDEAVRAGTAFLIPTNVSTLWELLTAAASRHQRANQVPVVSKVPSLDEASVTGNELGFYHAAPATHILVLNGSAINVTLSPLPAYSIQVGESLLLYTTLRELLDVSVFTDHRDVDELHLVGSVAVAKPASSTSVPTTVSVIVTVGGGALGGLASELQGVGVLAMMNCADPSTQGRFASYRILSPVAIADSYAGVVVGNVLLAACVGLFQVCFLLALRFGSVCSAASISWHGHASHRCSSQPSSSSTPGLPMRLHG